MSLQKNYVKVENLFDIFERSDTDIQRKRKNIAPEIKYFFILFGSRLADKKVNSETRDGDRVTLSNKAIQEDYNISYRALRRYIKVLVEVDLLKIQSEVGGENTYIFLEGIFKGYRADKDYLNNETEKEDNPKIDYQGQKLSYPKESVYTPPSYDSATQNASRTKADNPPVHTKQGSVETPCTPPSTNPDKDHAHVYNNLHETLKTPPTPQKRVGESFSKLSKDISTEKKQLARDWVSLQIEVEGKKAKVSERAWVQSQIKLNEEADTWDFIEKEINVMRKKKEAKQAKQIRTEKIKQNDNLKNKIQEETTKQLNILDEFGSDYEKYRSRAVGELRKNSFYRDNYATVESGLPEEKQNNRAQKGYERAIKACIWGYIEEKVKREFIPVTTGAYSA